MRKIFILTLMLISLFACSKPEKKICNCKSLSGPLMSTTTEIDMGYCDGTIPPRNNWEATYGYSKTCN